MQGFRAGHFDVLVATDIAARGIDVEKVSHVINFDVPNTPDAYTHRIGRTGRAERDGKAYTFASREDSAAVRAIERRLGAPIARRQVPSGLVGAKLAPAEAIVSPRGRFAGPRAHEAAGARQWRGRPRRSSYSN